MPPEAWWAYARRAKALSVPGRPLRTFRSSVQKKIEDDSGRAELRGGKVLGVGPVPTPLAPRLWHPFRPSWFDRVVPVGHFLAWHGGSPGEWLCPEPRQWSLPSTMGLRAWPLVVPPWWKSPWASSERGARVSGPPGASQLASQPGSIYRNTWGDMRGIPGKLF